MGSLLSQVQQISDFDSGRFWALYGRSNTGKTSFLRSVPKPLLVLSVADNGLRPLKTTEGILNPSCSKSLSRNVRIKSFRHWKLCLSFSAR